MNFSMNTVVMLMLNLSILDVMNFHYTNYNLDKKRQYERDSAKSPMEHRNQIQSLWRDILQLPRETNRNQSFIFVKTIRSFSDWNIFSRLLNWTEPNWTSFVVLFCFFTSGSFTLTDCWSWPKNFSVSCSEKSPKMKPWRRDKHQF